jgi:zinc protease
MEMIKIAPMSIQSFIFTAALVMMASCSHTPKQRTTSTGATLERSGEFDLIPIAGKFVAKRTRLPNGLKIIVIEDDSSPTFAYQTWFNVGSRNEIFGKTGLAHLFEHMMFKGTKKHAPGEFSSILDRAGAEGENAFTSNDHTVYIQELPEEHLETIMELESDRMHNLIVDDAAFKTEREVVQNERRMRKENSPEGTMYQTLFETAFLEHPYHWPVIGYEQDLNMMTAQDARDFYQKYYSPDRATVVVVGAVDADRVLKLAKRYYGNLAAKNTTDIPYAQEPEQTAQRRKRLSLGLEVEKLWLAFKTGPSSSPDHAVFEVIQSLLSDGMNSRLNRALVDTGVATSANSGSFGMRDPGLFVVFADLQKGKSSHLAEPIIIRELERLKSTPVSTEELQRAKNLVRFHFMERLTTHSGLANVSGDFETETGGLENVQVLQQRIQAVTPEQIMEVAKRYFDTKRLTVVVGSPK